MQSCTGLEMPGSFQQAAAPVGTGQAANQTRLEMPHTDPRDARSHDWSTATNLPGEPGEPAAPAAPVGVTAKAVLSRELHIT
jgi:hypothetical protein